MNVHYRKQPEKNINEQNKHQTNNILKNSLVPLILNASILSQSNPTLPCLQLKKAQTLKKKHTHLKSHRVKLLCPYSTLPAF